MKTIKSVFKTRNGPSSSHTVGPYNAAKIFKSRYPEADLFRVTLFGSLACTGEGHGTKKAIKAVMPNADVVFDREEKDLPHPNPMLFEAIKDGAAIGSCHIYSIGGGSIRIEGAESDDEKEIYPQRYFMEHNLGLTCDPVGGLVQIPCIERNAVAAMRAISSVNLSRFLYTTRKISFDEVVATMYQTGKDMNEKYRETSHGGLARIYYSN